MQEHTHKHNDNHRSSDLEKQSKSVSDGSQLNYTTQDAYVVLDSTRPTNTTAR